MGLLSIRIVGTESEVAEAAQRQEVLMNVLRKRGPYARRRTPGEVAVYLDVQLPDVPAAGIRAGTQ